MNQTWCLCACIIICIGKCAHFIPHEVSAKLLKGCAEGDYRVQLHGNIEDGILEEYMLHDRHLAKYASCQRSIH